MSTEKIHQTLPVKLSPKELQERSNSLAVRVVEQQEVKSEAKTAARNFKIRIDDIGAEIKLLTEAVLNKREDREVECELQPDFKRGVMETVRLDTEEVVESRPLLPAEMQAELFAERTH